MKKITKEEWKKIIVGDIMDALEITIALAIIAKVITIVTKLIAHAYVH